jgi:3D (Asp-Asp-Asp) domain-containing protein
MSKRNRKTIKNLFKTAKEMHYKSNVLLLIVVFSCSLTFPQHSFANSLSEDHSSIKLQGIIVEDTLLSILNSDIGQLFIKPSRLPEISYRKVELNTYSYVTAYNVGVVAQTDNTPCIGASGDDLCKMVEQGYNVCAANFVKLGTYLEIENIGKCIVLDRMNSRYNNTTRIDFAMGPDEITEAKKFGLQYKKFGIY